MQNKRWVRPVLAFLITFGALVMAGAIVRVAVAYQHFFAMGLQPDSGEEISRLTEELTRLDQLYTPVFLLVACLASAISAGAFAMWRPRAKVDLPPPLPS